MFRMKTEGPIRQRVLDLDVVEAVIGLGPNLFYGAGLAACILVARRQKREDRRAKVLLIDASELFRKGKPQNTLDPSHVEEILGAYDAFASEGRARVVTLDEIRENGGSLRISTYLTTAASPEIPSVVEARAELERALSEAWTAEAKLSKLLAQRDIG